MLKIIKTKRKYIPKEEILIESVKEAYLDFIDFIENPIRRGYMILLYKLKPQSREPIKAKLLDIRIEVENDLIRVRNRMRGVTGYYDTPNGIKK